MYVNDDSKRDTGDGRSSEIVRSGKVPVIAPDGAFLSEESFPLPGGAGEATGSKAPLLPSLLRFKGLILTIFVVVAVPSIAAIWVLVAPEYKARAEIRVSPIRPKFVFPTEENGMIPLYESYKNTQVAVILSPTVLQRALEEEEVQTTKWLRDPPKSLSQWLGGQAETSMERLRAAITVSPRRQSEIIDISFSAQDGKEAADVVNAIVDHYMVDVAEKTDETHDILYRKLTAQHQILRDGISTHEKFLAGLRKELGTGLPDELIAKRRVRLDETQAHLDEIRRKVSVLEMHKRELRSGAISTQQMERIEYIQVVSGMNAEQREQLRDRLAAHLQMWRDQMARDEADLRELTNALAMDPNDPAAKRNRKLEEVKARMVIVKDQTEAIEWRMRELKRVGQAPVEERAAPTGQLWVCPEYHSDPEWDRLNLAVGTVRTMQPAGTGPANARADCREELKLKELELASLSARAQRERAEFEEVFSKAQLMDKESRVVRHKLQLFQAVQERLDQKRMERNVPASIDVLTRAIMPTKASGDRRALYTILVLVVALGAAIVWRVAPTRRLSASSTPNVQCQGIHPSEDNEDNPVS